VKVDEVLKLTSNMVLDFNFLPLEFAAFLSQLVLIEVVESIGCSVIINRAKRMATDKSFSSIFPPSNWSFIDFSATLRNNMKN
jgi:hypothetical protein